jgi:hypothetical protein
VTGALVAACTAHLHEQLLLLLHLALQWWVLLLCQFQAAMPAALTAERQHQ